MSVFFFSSRRRHTRWPRDWSSDVCSSDLAFALCQYLHSFYFLALFDYEIACPLVQLISLFAFYKLHNSYVNRSFLGGTNVRHFCSFPSITSMYSITHYTFCPLSDCSARLFALTTPHFFIISLKT